MTKKKSVHDATAKTATAQSQPASSPKKSEQRDAKGKFKKGHAHRWQKGTSGNPAGPPKYVTLSQAYREALAKIDPYDPEKRTYAQLIAQRQLQVALGLTTEQSSHSAREIADRTEGRARQPIELDVKGEALQLLAAFLGVSVEQLPKP
jgi:hypothetical protein